MENLLQKAIIEDLYRVADYWQMKTDIAIVNIFTTPQFYMLDSNQISDEPSRPLIIGKSIIDECYIENKCYKLKLESGCVIIIPLMPETSFPEAVNIHYTESNDKQKSRSIVF